MTEGLTYQPLRTRSNEREKTPADNLVTKTEQTLLKSFKMPMMDSRNDQIHRPYHQESIPSNERNEEPNFLSEEIKIQD